VSRANAGDLVVICVDQHGRVLSEVEQWSNQAQAGSGDNPDTADPDYTPAGA
jgi:cyanophycin synthetase